MRLDVAPALGGAILGWHDGALALLRPSFARSAAPFSVRDCASFPLIPFSNRVAHGHFPFGGQVYDLPRDCRDPRHAMHGNALYAAWEVDAVSESELELSMAYRAGMSDVPYFPFSYEARQRYRIRPDRMQIDLAITNRDTRNFPAGLGHHLYFASEPDTVVAFRAGEIWLNDQEGLPFQSETAGMDEFAKGHEVASRPLDNCFGDWSGSAAIFRPSRGVRLDITASESLRYIVLFTPANQPFFALEPVSHLNDAVHRIAARQTHGLRVLSPGQTFEACMVIQKTVLS
jgi:aldose 1-epimerase